MHIPNFSAQLWGDNDPESIALHVLREDDFPYARPRTRNYLTHVNWAGKALGDFYEVWMRFMEGKANG